MAKKGPKRQRQTFYVFYNKQDFVDCCGTAHDLVKEGRFKSVNGVHTEALRRNQRRPNSVVKIVLPKCARRSVYAK